ncbi:MAG: tRNA uridine-5-carboxymethylaminomethyl(34) synthesis GTPase MnmE [Candidatus Competibacteraceae bacterium]|nr:tRNA uridine-5-carboxymethylaminomethyl(34) synthesis GTPase MnmE [Candidatus Competibacteraceae bacterium]
MMTDTIAAIATPPGRGGIGIVRVSGPATPAIASVLCGALPRPRYAELRAFRAADDTIIDQGIALFFPAPHSFTGEPVLELQGHGGPVVMDMLLARVVELGARLARPGEFTERAFLNDKLDLAQAEAVADLIEASTAAAARAAMGSLQGVFSQQVNALVEGLIQLRLYVESAIDFPEEEIDFLSDGHVATQLGGLQSQLRRLLNEAGQGQLLRDGMSIVIAGQPNAGKSSLLNQLAGRDSAIVTAIPGTTRDVLREYIDIDGMPLRVIDTAGLRESSDLVEQEGIRRAWREIKTADRVLLVVDSRDGINAEDQAIRARLPASVPLTLILNKIDLSQETPGEQTGDWGPVIKLSAKTGTGLDVLRQHLKTCMGYQTSGEGAFIARRRHLDALRRAAEQLANAQVQLEQYQAGELVAEELRLAQNHLSEITGEFTSDDLLGRIFSSFCIGK